MKKFFKLFSLLSIPILLINCATIMHGKFQQITLNSNPQGALVKINNQEYKTPTVVTLDRSVKSYVIEFTKDGYKKYSTKIERSVDAALFGNILFGGIIGIVIDFGNGSAYKLNPEEIEAILEIENINKSSLSNSIIILSKNEIENYIELKEENKLITR